MPPQQMWHSQDFLRVVHSERVSLTHQNCLFTRAQLNGSDRSAFHKAVNCRVSAETQGMYVTMCKYLWMYIYIYIYIYDTVCNTLVFNNTQNM